MPPAEQSRIAAASGSCLRSSFRTPAAWATSCGCLDWRWTGLARCLPSAHTAQARARRCARTGSASHRPQHVRTVCLRACVRLASLHQRRRRLPSQAFMRSMTLGATALAAANAGSNVPRDCCFFASIAADGKVRRRSMHQHKQQPARAHAHCCWRCRSITLLRACCCCACALCAAGDVLGFAH